MGIFFWKPTLTDLSAIFSQFLDEQKVTWVHFVKTCTQGIDPQFRPLRRMAEQLLINISVWSNKLNLENKMVTWYIKRKNIDYGKFFDCRAQKCI